jgi:hypothetical protein
MNNLMADREEMETAAGKRWVATMRRRYGIRPNEAACWFAYKEQEMAGTWDRNMETLGRSPADVLAYAECLASGARHRFGLGTWILETWGDGETRPLYLRVYPMLDDPQP